MTEETPTFWGYVKSFFKRVGEICIRYPLAVAATVLLVVAAIFLIIFRKKFQIGGLLNSVWGKKPQDNEPVLQVPSDRIDPNTNKPIPLGESDPNGFVQPVPVKIVEPGIFSDPNKVTVVTPEGKEVDIKLPTGVTNEEVQKVVMVSPNTYQIANNDKGTDAGKLLEDISK